MSNFICEHCGTPILEGEGGHYITGCVHYPDYIAPLSEEEDEELRKETRYGFPAKIYPGNKYGDYMNICIHCEKQFVGYKNDPNCGDHPTADKEKP
jgi:hypothetical protein